MKLLVIGATGMAGHLITTYLREQHHQVSTLAHSHPLDPQTHLIDLNDIVLVKDYLNSHYFDAVINCAGMLVQAAENNKAAAIHINSYFPHFLEDFYAPTSTRVIHLSTDCVFSGIQGFYTESSICDGTLFYDRTKALGEIINDKDLTFRMSIIGPDLSPKGVGLLNWFLLQKGDLKGYKNVEWNGITTLTLAQAIHAALTQNIAGLYHLVPSEPISKYELLLLFQKHFKKEDVVISPCETPISNKVLVNTRKDFNYQVPNYEIMIETLYHWVKEHKKLYPHYNF